MIVRRLFGRVCLCPTPAAALALALVALPICGCSKSTDAKPGEGAASQATTGSTGKIAGPSAEERTRWLASGLPPLKDEIAANPVKLLDAKLEANEFGQEVLTVNFERPAVVRTLASELKLVLLPTAGGRADVYTNPSLLIQPQNSGHISGIVGGLLDHRGKLRSGVRAYLEMHAATIGGPAPKAERVSDVVWIGSDDQLATALRQGTPPDSSSSSPISDPKLQALPAGKIAKGTPLWMRCGDRWSRGNAIEDATGDQVRLLIYLVRRDKPYMPWVADLPRSELRIEEPAQAELQKDANAFQDLADANELKLSRHGVPNKLVPVSADNLAAGTAVLDFWNGMLDPCHTTGPIQDGAVPIQRDGLDNAQMVKPVKGLFLDPFAKNDSSGNS